MPTYSLHLSALQERYEALCSQHKLDAILIHSGGLTYYAGDDMSHTFKPAAFAQQWLPYDLDPQTWILFQPGQKPTLYWPAKQDFWHVIPSEPSGRWTEHWQIKAATSEQWAQTLTGNNAIITNDLESIPKTLTGQVNPDSIIYALSYSRAYKTDWEIQQIVQANLNAAKGHIAAQTGFFDGLSEHGIYQMFLDASEQMQTQEPYSAIVGLNQSAAVLHYELKNRVVPAEHRTLLIDAGAKVNGYASDITRTVTNDQGLFSLLLEKMEALQLTLCAACTENTDYLTIHNLTLTGIATILQETNICSLDVASQLSKRIPQIFFPHGIGHLLGLHVHDVGGKQLDDQGTIKSSPVEAPFLRMTRRLENSMVITIEPGLYFIPMLIDQMINNISDHGCDLALIDSLIPYGGIRIEDNVLIKGNTPINLTRNAFAELLNAD